MTLRTLLGGLLPLFGLLLIVGCSDSSTSPSGHGQLKLMMVDSPASFEQVNIVVTKVDVHLAGSDSTSGWITVNSTPATYDLLLLTNGANSVIGDKMLSVGKYTQIRLAIGSGSNVVVGGITYPLNVTSATGLKLNHNFEIEQDKLYLLTLDFDAGRSVTLTNTDEYRLKPVIRVVANVVSGTIAGVIHPVSVRTTISTVAGTDTISTASDAVDGSFMLTALPMGVYDLTIAPDSGTYFDSTISNIQVAAEQNVDIGTVDLVVKP